MNVDEYVLAVLSTSNGKPYSPAQIQKLFFLMDREASELIGGKKFGFEPYDYGPFDQGVYRSLDQLEALGLVQISSASGYSVRSYRTTVEGQISGERYFNSLSDGAKKAAQTFSDWVRKQSFSSLVSAIYRKYPDMKAKSIFKEEP